MTGEQASQERISFWVRFASQELENRFREHIRHQELRQMYASVAGGVFVAAVFVASDRAVVGEAASQYLLIVRLAFLAVSCVTILLLQRSLTAALRSWILFGWVLCGVATSGIVASTRSSEYFAGQVVVSNFILMLVYTVVPLLVPMQVVAALLLTANDIWLLMTRHGDLNPVVRRAMLTVYLLTNLVGAFTSHSRNHLKREQFLLLEREKRLNAELEDALDEVRTLRGILPICSNCRKICNEKGAWEPLDSYVRSHSQAEFSHGICPDCLKPMLSELGEDIGAPQKGVEY
ncbi:MAG TPA: hypothetical protein VEF06_05395 [Bryobacteraceae bacterium]|nr:hypothetical protein [Bryobacteraceae bacterium]